MPQINLLQMINSAQWGGGEAHLLSLVCFFARLGFKVHTAFPEHGPLLEAVRNYGAEAHILKWKGPDFPIAVVKLAGIITKNRIDIIHSHDTRTHLIARVAGKLVMVPALISTYHMPITAITDIGLIKKSAYLAPDKLTFPLCDRAIAVSEAVKERLLCDGYPATKRLSVIYNGVDLSRFKPKGQPELVLRQLGIPTGACVIGTVGRLSPEKSQVTLIKAMLQIKKSFPNARCLIVGGGQLDGKLRKIIHDLGLSENCILTGHIEDVTEILSIMDLFVLPSLTEGFPLSLLEAMAMSRAVVASNVGGIPEIVEEGKTGFLVAPGDEYRLSEVIIRLLYNGELRRDMGAAGRRRVEKKFELNAAIGKIERLYYQVLTGK